MWITARLRIFVAWYDLWVGLYYDRKGKQLYVCPLPCLVFQIDLLSYYAILSPDGTVTGITQDQGISGGNLKRISKKEYVMRFMSRVYPEWFELTKTDLW